MTTPETPSKSQRATSARWASAEEIVERARRARPSAAAISPAYSADRERRFHVNVNSAEGERLAGEFLRQVFTIGQGLRGTLRIESPVTTSGMRWL